MEEASAPSTQSARTSTGKTGRSEKFTPEEALEILEKALHVLDQAGVPVFITPIHDQGEESTGIIIRQTQLGPNRHIKYTGNQA